MASGRRVLVGTRPMTRVSRAVEKGETAGFIKVLADADSRAILGAAILGVEGDEAMHAVLDLMYAGAPVETIARRRPHPPDRRRAAAHRLRRDAAGLISGCATGAGLPQNGSAALMNGSRVWMRDQQSASAPSAAPDPIREKAARRVPPSL